MSTRLSFPFVPVVGLLLQRDDHLFLIRRCNTGFKDGEYCMPAGHKEAGETPMEAIIREAKEEVGIEVAADDLEFVHVMHRTGEPERVSFYFRAHKWSGEPTNAEPSKCDDAGWFPLAALPENTVDFHRHALAMIAQGKAYSQIVL